MRLPDAISSQMTRWASAAVAAVVVLGACASPSLAASSYLLTVTFTQNGTEVDASFDGRVDTAVLTSSPPTASSSGLADNPFSFVVGGVVDPSSVPISEYSVANLSGFANVASGLLGIAASSASGDVFGVDTGFDALLLPSGYTSQSLISGSSVFANNTLAGLGLNVGTYSVRFASVDNIRIIVGSGIPVPEPASMALLAAGVAGIGAVRRRKRA